jgi:WD40 repeat protein
MTQCHAIPILQDQTTVLQITQLSPQYNNIVAALSNKQLAIVTLDQPTVTALIDVQTHINQTCVATQFPNCVCTVSNAACAIWDLRTKGNQKLVFADYLKCNVSDHQADAFDLGPFGSGFISGDMNSASFFATGDHLGNIHIWDLRMPEKLLNQHLGSISEFHTGMVTDVKFHPSYPNFLFSGSEDGLVQKFDLNAPNVEDSLVCGKV